MAAGNSVVAPERTVITTRIFDAPRELVYGAWTDPTQLAQWFPPKDFTSPRCEVDPRPGGVFRCDMKAPAGPPFDGAVFPGAGVFREVVPNERLAFTFKGEGDVPPPILMAVIFESQGNRTKLTIYQTAETVAEYEALLKLGVTEGLKQSFEKLDALLGRSAAGSTVTVRSQVNRITPFLWFDDKAEEAMRFYVSIFRNSRVLSVSPGPSGAAMTVTFELDGQEFMALNAGPRFKFTEAISFFVSCATQEEVDELWEKLSEGGEEGRCGWLRDKYGLSWQIVPTALGELLGDQDREKAKRVMEAMLKMGKIDIGALERAYGH
jgi:predicted 3-demethylubiquinone-9 3-methyltransferase (glyoxalase superfamily)/uncharacterized protein YndB with AHSA1/START domain